MIKVAIKHFIYEKCIDVFFNAISRNFDTNPMLLVEGETYKEIQLIRNISMFSIRSKYKVDVLREVRIIKNTKDILTIRPLRGGYYYRDSCDFIDSTNLYCELIDEVRNLQRKYIIDYKVTK